MENEMIERVAEALKRNPTLCFMSEAAGGGSEEWERDVREIARAAIEAMREPTEAMNFDGGTIGDYPWDGRKPARIWKAMIDTALTRKAP